MEWLSGRRLLALLLVAGGAALVASFLTIGYTETWGLWGFPVMTPHFADLRTITGGAESYALGFDPMVANPGDPWQRVMNYPRVWQALFLLHIDQSDTTWLGLTIIALFVAGLFLFMPRLDRGATLLLFAALCSPAVMLAVERGNNDLAVFFLVALALFLLPRSLPVAIAALLGGVLLKLFPLFALMVLLREPPRRLLGYAGVAVGLVVIYLGLTIDDLRLMQQGVLKGTLLSFGIGVFPQFHGEGSEIDLAALRAAAWSRVVALAGVGYLLSRRFCLIAAAEGAALDAFRAGAGIYLGTFLLGQNWDYRLTFLLLTLPQLFVWVQVATLPGRLLAGATLTALLLSLWSLLLFPGFAAPTAALANYLNLDEALNWALFAGLLWLLIATLPGWLRAPLGLRVPGDTPPAARPWVARGAGLVAVLGLGVINIQHAAPLYSWDLLGYTGVVNSWRVADPSETHRLTYEESRQALPDPTWRDLTEADDYRRSCSTDAEAFRQQLPFYAVNPAYPALIWLAGEAGMGPVAAGELIPRLAYLGIAMLLAVWLMGLLGATAGTLVTLALISSSYLITLSRLPSPDALSALLLLGGVFLLLRRGVAWAGWLLLVFSVTARPDNILLLGPLAGWVVWHLPRWRGAALIALVAGVALCLMQVWWAGGYGWPVLFYHGLLQPLPRPAEFQPLLGPLGYLEVYQQLLSAANIPGGLLLFLGLGSIALVGWRRLEGRSLWVAVVGASLTFMIGHWFILPLQLDRSLAGGYVLTVLAIAALWQRLPAVAAGSMDGEGPRGEASLHGGSAGSP